MSILRIARAIRSANSNIAIPGAINIALAVPKNIDIHDCEFDLLIEGQHAIALPGYYANDGQCDCHFPHADSGQKAAQDYVDGGSWADYDGAVDVLTWRLAITESGESLRICEESFAVDVPVDHGAMIRAAAGQSKVCGYDPKDHDWSSEGEGGLAEDPGVWSLGGTAMMYRQHCTCCGLRREVVRRGSQRNPGEAEAKTTYSLVNGGALKMYKASI